MIDNAIWVAIITGVCAVIGQWLISKQTVKQKKTDDAVRDARLDDRLNSVEEKLNIHNGYAEKFEEIRIDIAQIRKDIEYIGKR